ncbi:unnamed protein product, partial [marine sediment metagenome]
MRTEQETRDLKAELTKLTGFIAEYSDRIALDKADIAFACNVC